MKYILAIDQGTTSTRAMLFDGAFQVVAISQEEFPQHFPRSGWVEHDADDLWATTAGTCRKVIERARIDARDIVAIGITNQRETSVVWDRETGKALSNAIVWQDRRTADFCRELREAGHSDMITRRTGLLIDPYFSATKVKWILDNTDGARERARRGELLFGTVDSFLIWKLTGGKVHATDATNAARTMLYDIHKGRWSHTICDLLDIPAEMLPEVRDCAADFGLARADLFGREIPILGVAGDQHAATIDRTGLFHAGDAEIDLWHGMFRAAEHRRNAGAVEEPSFDHHRLSAERHADLCAGRFDICRRFGRAMAAGRVRCDP